MTPSSSLLLSNGFYSNIMNSVHHQASARLTLRFHIIGSSGFLIPHLF